MSCLMVFAPPEKSCEETYTPVQFVIPTCSRAVQSLASPRRFSYISVVPSLLFSGASAPATPHGIAVSELIVKPLRENCAHFMQRRKPYVQSMQLRI
jgi:hypothetical protein